MSFAVVLITLLVKFSEAALSSEGCGTTIGCLRYPENCNGTDCSYMATFSFQNNRVLFALFGKDAAWVSIGFSDNRDMPNTDAIVCYANNSVVQIKSSRIAQKARPPLEEANDLTGTAGSFSGGNIQCSFSHPYIPNSGSQLRSLDKDVYLLYAKGPLDAGVLIGYHTSEESHRGASTERIQISTGESETREIGGISTAGCGQTMGCLRSPSDCNGASCDYAATYAYNPTANLVTFEMFGKDADWVGIGFSDDTKMPNTDAVFCYILNGNVILRSAKLVGRTLPTLEEENDLTLLDNGRDAGLRCRFGYPLTPSNTSTLRNLNQQVYLLYAKGSVSNRPEAHSRGPSSRGNSDQVVNVTTNIETLATSPSRLKKKVHGSLMAVVWILLASSGLFFARYTRDNWSDTKLFGTKIWFQFHRFLMILVVVGTITSIVVIFVDLDGFTDQEGTTKTHAIIGLVVLALAVLQPIGAILRPHPGTAKRPIFNFFHRTFGIAAFVLAIVTVILGLDIFEKDEAYYTVIGFAGFLAGVLLIMEMSKFIYDRKEESLDATVPGGMQMETKIAGNKPFHLTLTQIFLVVVDIVSLAVTVVVIYYIAEDDDD